MLARSTGIAASSSDSRACAWVTASTSSGEPDRVATARCRRASATRRSAVVR